MAGKEGKVVYDAFQEAKKRCEEVHDGRFYALLTLAQAANTEGTRRADLRRHFNAMAYANYLYGASNFAKDQSQSDGECAAKRGRKNALRSEGESFGMPLRARHFYLRGRSGGKVSGAG